MKLFFSEFRADYARYHFPYQVWLFKEEGDDIDKIYENGFLPVRNLRGVYYLSRNIRVNLEKFELSSENRRILRKSNDFESDRLPLSEFVYKAETQKLCKTYADSRFGKGTFSTAAIKNIFRGEIYNYVFVFKEIKTKNPVGYAVSFITQNFLQYAHSFYSLDFFKENLGARMILETIIWAKKSGKKYAYLGTCYEEKALYKTEFKGTEFFNGFTWSDNLNELKALIKRDSPDYLLKDKIFLDDFYEGDLQNLMSKFGIRVTL